jgi:hypothetical protein
MQLMSQKCPYSEKGLIKVALARRTIGCDGIMAAESSPSKYSRVSPNYP